MAKTDAFTFCPRALNKRRMMIMARGGQMSASAWLNEKIAEAWRSAFGDASPEEVGGFFAEPGSRIRCANGQQRRIS